MPKGNARINTPGTNNNRDNQGSKLGRVAGSVSGFHQDNMSRNAAEEFKRD